MAETVVIDGVAYSPDRIKQIILERHQLASEMEEMRADMILLRDTLRLRTEALNRTGETNDRLRAEVADLKDRLEQADYHIRCMSDTV